MRSPLGESFFGAPLRADTMTEIDNRSGRTTATLRFSEYRMSMEKLFASLDPPPEVEVVVRMKKDDRLPEGLPVRDIAVLLFYLLEKATDGHWEIEGSSGATEGNLGSLEIEDGYGELEHYLRDYPVKYRVIFREVLFE